MKSACLNLRTENSLDAIASTTALLDRAREYRVTAVGRADRHSMIGMESFLREAERRGLHAVAGVELDLESPVGSQGLSGAYPLVLFAENETGFTNLGRLVSAAHRRAASLSGRPAAGALHPHWGTAAGRPRITIEDLEQHRTGLIAQSPGLAGEVPIRILRSEADLAERLANRLAEIFGRSSLYLGISLHGRSIDARLGAEVARLGERTGIPVVEANVVDHMNPDDLAARDLRAALAGERPVGSPVPGPATHFRTPVELAALFRNHPDALENAMHLALRCRLDRRERILPRYPIPGRRTEAQYLASLCRRSRTLSRDSVRAGRLDRELRLIAERGLAGYFLILWDLVRHARSRDLAIGPAGGAINATLVAFQLGITRVDPVEHGLEFEHFLSECETALPAFTLPAGTGSRQELASYLEHRYGADRVAPAGHMELYSPRDVLREAGGLLGLEDEEVDLVSKKASNDPEADLALVVAHDSRLARRYRQDERVRTWLNLARRLQGLPKKYLRHPSGFVLAAGPGSAIPVQRTADGSVVAQVSWNDAAMRGFLRIDLPGRNDLIAPEPGARQVGLFEAATRSASGSSRGAAFRALGSGEAPLPRDLAPLVQAMKPKTLLELAAAVSLRHLARAGRDLRERYLRRLGGEEVFDLGDPELDRVLGPTQGLLLDQEQIAEVACTFSDLDAREAEELRQAISGMAHDGNRRAAGPAVEELAGWRGRFVSGAARRGVAPGRAEEVFVGLIQAGRAAPERAASLAEAILILDKAYAALASSEAGTAGAAPPARAGARGIRETPEGLSLVPARLRPRGDQMAFTWPDGTRAGGWNYRHTGTDGPR